MNNFPKIIHLQEKERQLESDLIGVKQNILYIQYNCKHEEEVSSEIFNSGDYERDNTENTCMKCGYVFYSRR